MPEKRIPKYIPGYGKSYAMLARTEAVDTAIIFVHGFNGNPTSTWRNFQGLVDEYTTNYPWWASSDMFFYAYESLQTPIRRNAELLQGFATVVWNDSWRQQNSDAKRKYKDIIFAGHSEGGVVIRRMILDRYESIKAEIENTNPNATAAEVKTAMRPKLESDFLLSSYLRLFAPACMGTNFSSWAGFMTSFSHFVAALTASSLVRNELLPGSPVLTGLKTGTEKAHAEFRQIRSLFVSPLFGIPDQIVYSESYEGEALLWDEGYDHFGVCKPLYTHILPLEFVSK